jgi:hypothetical protein
MVLLGLARMLGSKLGKNGLKSVFAFSGLFCTSFVSVFFGDCGT